MTLRGDLKDINLADIFQTLAMNQQEGTLTIWSGNRRMDIYFSKEGVRLLVSGDKKYLRLGEILLREKKITPVELDMALARQKMTGEMLGQALIDMGIVTAEEIEKAVRHQIEEEIFDVFSWKDAKFEFVPGEPKGDFFDPAKLGKPITFNVQSIIMEAARRIDEWNLIHSVIPSMQVIFRVVDPYAQPPKIAEKAGVDERIITSIIELIDGKRTVEQIVEESGLGKFEVCKVLAMLAQARYIEPLSVKETVVVADQYANEGDIQRAIKIYKSVLENLPPSSVLRNRLAELYEKAGQPQEAAMEYAELADALLQEKAEEDALALYRKALELAPRNFGLHQKLFEFYLSKKNKGGAVQEGLFVARGFWRMNRLQEAKDVLERLLNIAPDNIEIRQMLINICLDLDQKDNAVKHYEYLANYYKDKGGTEEVIQIYRKILAIDRERKDIRAELDKLLAKGEQKKGVVTLWIGLGIVLVIAVGGVLFWRYNKEAGTVFDSLTKRISSLMSEEALRSYSLREREAIIREIQKKIDEAGDRYRFAFFVSPDSKIKLLREDMKSLLALKRKVDEQEKERLTREQRRIEKLLAEARTRFDECNLKGAIEILKEILDFCKKEPESVPKDYARRAEDLLLKAQREMREAKMLYEESVVDEKNGDIRNAFLKRKTILMRCPHSEEAKKVLLPLLIETEPSDAEVMVDGETKRSPSVFHRSPGTNVQVIIKKRGYRQEEFTVSDEQWFLKVKLQRVPVWTTDLSGAVGEEEFVAPPFVVDDMVFAFSEGCKVVCVRATDGKLIWSLAIGSPGGTFLNPGVVTDGKLVVVEQCQAESLIHIVDIKARKEICKPIHLPGRALPFLVNGKVYIRGDDVLYCLTKDLKDIEWEFVAESRIVAGPVYDKRSNFVLIAQEGGKVIAFTPGTKEIAWQSTLLEATPYGTLYFWQDTVVAVCQGGVVKALYTWKEPPMSGGKQIVSRLAWTAKVSGEPYPESPVFAGDRLYFIDLRGILHAFDLKSQKELWVTRKQVVQTFMGAPVVWGEDAVAVVGAGGVIKVLKASNGEEIWRFAKERVMTRPVVYGDTIILLTTNGKRSQMVALVR